MKLKRCWFAVLIILNMFDIACVKAQGKTMDIWAANKLLDRTVNIGYTFDAPKEGMWGNTLTTTDFSNIKSAGFTAIRLPVQWVARMGNDSLYQIDPQFLSRIDEVVQLALKNHLAIIIENCLMLSS